MKNALMVGAMAGLVTAAAAEETRQLDAHVHGVGHLNIAFEGSDIAMELEVPGADIVGFEHVPRKADDRSAVEEALSTLTGPLDLFVLPEAAGCAVTDAGATLVLAEEEHDAQDGHGEDEAHADHGDQEHAAEAHDDHGADEEHAEESHGGEAEATHTEFHATYTLTCDEPGAVDRIEFAYFERFSNAEELEIQMISDSGANRFEVKRDEPVLELEGQI